MCNMLTFQELSHKLFFSTTRAMLVYIFNNFKRNFLTLSIKKFCLCWWMFIDSGLDSSAGSILFDSLMIKCFSCLFSPYHHHATCCLWERKELPHQYKSSFHQVRHAWKQQGGLRDSKQTKYPPGNQSTQGF